MAIILEFRRTEEAVSRIVKPGENSLGEIIIFPGVRIERRGFGQNPTETNTPTPRRAQRSRKK
jgi:hypothetical protein